MKKLILAFAFLSILGISCTNDADSDNTDKDTVIKDTTIKDTVVKDTVVHFDEDGE